MGIHCDKELVWSPDFWNLYGEKIMREIVNEPSITVGGHNADDTVLGSHSHESLQSLLDKVQARLSLKVPKWACL